MGKEDIAVIILNYKTWEDTLDEAQLVHDLFDLEWKQIIIVDNASPNNSSIELGKKEIGDYTFIESKENRGYASGNNIGLKYAYTHGYKYGWILNNDIIISDSNVLIELIRVFEIDSKVAVVNPDVYSPNGHLYNRDSKKTTFFDLTIGMYSYKKRGRNIDDLGGYGYIYRPQGCCMMLDLNKAYEVNFLDEHTFLYCEEAIYSERLLKHGWKCACATTICIIHNHSKTVRSVMGKWRMLKIQNQSLEYCLKEYRHYSFVKRKICVLFNTIKNLLVK